MMVIYMKNIAYEKAFDLIDELKEMCHEKKRVIFDLEKTIRQCLEYGKEDEYSDLEDYDNDLDDDLYDDDDNVNSSERRNEVGRRHSQKRDIRYYEENEEPRRRSNMPRKRRVGRFV